MVLLAALALAQGSSWQPLPAVTATGTSQMQSGPPRTFTVARSGSSSFFAGILPIGTDLSGVERREVSGSEGVYTWLGDKPKFLLQLPFSSAYDLTSMLRPPAFGREELLKTPAEVGRRFGGKAKLQESEELNGASAIVFDLSFGDLIRRTWLDAQTGATLRYQEMHGKSVIMGRSLDSVEPGVAPERFVKPAGRVIRGIVRAGILQRAGQAGDPEKDFERAEKGCKMSYKGWLRKPPAIDGFVYTQSSDWSAASRRAGGVPGLPEGVPMPPPGSAVLTSQGGDLVFFTAGATTAAAEIERSAQGVEVQVIELSGAELAANSSLVFRTGLVLDNAASPLGRDATAGASGYLHSDYLDPATGDTVTVLQTANLRLDPFFRGIKLPKQKPVDGVPGMESYSVSAPFKMNVVVWQHGGAIYAVASTRHEVADLVKIARALTP